MKKSIYLLLFLSLFSLNGISQNGNLYKFAVKANSLSWLLGRYDLTLESQLYRALYLEVSRVSFSESSFLAVTNTRSLDLADVKGFEYESGMKFYLFEQKNERLFPSIKLSYRYGERVGRLDYREFKGVALSYDQTRFENAIKITVGFTLKLKEVVIEPYLGAGCNWFNVKTIGITPSLDKAKYDKLLKSVNKLPTGKHFAYTYHFGAKIGFHTSFVHYSKRKD